MSLVFDVKSIQVDNQSPVEFGVPGVVSLEVSTENPVTNLELTVPNTVETLAVEVPGPQGAPGLKNVYVSATDPSKDKNGNTIWGPEKTNYIWIKV